MADKKPTAQPTPEPPSVFGSVYAARPPAPEGDPTQARSDHAANLPSRVPGLDQTQLQAMFESVLEKSPITDEVKQLRLRVSELETQTLALAALQTLEAATPAVDVDTSKPAKKTPAKKGK